MLASSEILCAPQSLMYTLGWQAEKVSTCQMVHGAKQGKVSHTPAKPDYLVNQKTLETIEVTHDIRCRPACRCVCRMHAHSVSRRHDLDHILEDQEAKQRREIQLSKERGKDAAIDLKVRLRDLHDYVQNLLQMNNTAFEVHLLPSAEKSTGLSSSQC